MSRILLIDDNDAFRTTVRGMLVAAGHDVEDAAGGKAGLACYRQQPSDLVITDMLMADFDGVETIRELCCYDAGVKVIAMSTGGRKSTDYYLEMALKWGACRFLAKPFSPQALYMTVAEVLATSQSDLHFRST
jgi:DNA-binding NtrC family response regulator